MIRRGRSQEPDPCIDIASKDGLLAAQPIIGAASAVLGETGSMAREEDGNGAFDRVRWLGHPAFFAGVAVLVVNDHVLKARFPGWWTGKLSDFAGVAVVAVILAVLGGRRVALPATAVLFVALKTVPGGAELAAPVLGGVTRRDWSDLIALAGLVPLWFLLAPSPRSNASFPCADHPIPDHSKPRSRTALATILPIFGALVAAAATTATSCAPDPAVVLVTSDGQDLYALVNESSSSRRWARSDDRGETWQSSEAPRSQVPKTTSDPYVDPGQIGPQEACTTDRTCWRLQGRRVIERVDADGAVTEELRLSEKAFSDITTGCTGTSVGVLASITATDTGPTSTVVASYGAQGIVVRQADGTWRPMGVLSAPGGSTSGSTFLIRSSMAWLVLLLGIAVWQFGRLRLRPWQRGLATAGTGLLGTITSSAAISLLSMDDPGQQPLVRQALIVGICLTVISTGGAVRWPRPDRR